MQFQPPPGRPTLRPLLPHPKPLGTGSASRSPLHIALSMNPHRRHEHPSLHGPTGMVMVPLELASPPTRPGCEPPKRARSVEVGKLRYAASSIRLVVYKSNGTMCSATARTHARGARLEGCTASIPASAGCVDRIKDRARTVNGKKIPSTHLANHTFPLHSSPPANAPVCLSSFLFLSYNHAQRILDSGLIGRR